jgi:hypothetical protein
LELFAKQERSHYLPIPLKLEYNKRKFNEQPLQE